MIKVLRYRFQKFLDTFTMALVEGFSEAGLFRHLSDYVFRVHNFGNKKSMRDIFFPKYLKFDIGFKNAVKN